MMVGSVQEVAFLICVSLEVTGGVPRKYLSGNEDPPSCDGTPRVNPFPGKCGKRVSGSWRRKRDGPNSSDIVGGRDVFPGEFPWFADVDSCGATIANEDTLISSAHCFEEDKRGHLVVAGSVYPMKQVVSAFDSSVYCGTQIRRIVDVINHPKYCSEASYKAGKCSAPFQWDLALVKVNRAFEWDARVQPACLPAQDWRLDERTKFQIVGNGYTDYDTQELAEMLQVAEVPLLDKTTCRNWLTQFVVTDEMLCAGFAEGGRDACVGDSGGPLFLLPGEDANAAGTTLVGVVSWGIHCAQAKTPGVYARVDKGSPWIQCQIKIRARNLQDDEDAQTTASRSPSVGIGGVSVAMFWGFLIIN